MDINLSKLWEAVKDREAYCTVVHGITVRRDLVIEQWQQQNIETSASFLPTYIFHHYYFPKNFF